MSDARRSVLLTGVTSDLGLRVAEKFVRSGSYVFGCGRKLERLRESSEIIAAQEAGSFVAIQTDLTSIGEIRQLSRRVQAQQIGLDSIVHVGGGASARGRYDELSPEDWLRTYDANVISLVRLVLELCGLLQAGIAPSILAVGSSTAMEPGYFDPHYSAAKAALQNFVKHLSRQLGPEGVRVNLLSLGPVLSGHWASDNASSEELDRMATQIPMGRLGSPEEVAEVIWHLDSAAFGWLNGADIRLDGGKTVRI